MTAIVVDNRPVRRNGKKRTTKMNSDDKARRRRSIIRRDGNQCAWCEVEFSEETPPTIDHLLPLKDGGTDRLENLVLACEDCNVRRSNPPLGRRRVASDG